MLLTDLLVVYCAVRLVGGSPHTVKLYEHSIRLFGQTLGRAPTVADLVDERVGLHLQRLLNDGYSRASVAKERAQLLAMANFASRRGLLTTWLEVRPIRQPERVPIAWTMDELRSLLKACQSVPGAVCGVSARMWWTSLHLALWASGERITAMLSARWSDYDGRRLLITAEARKNQTRDRLYELSPEACLWIERARLPGRELIWPWDRSIPTLYHHYSRLLISAGLEHDKRSKFHRMRRSVASHLTQAGGDAQDQLDHQSARMTRLYLDPRIVQRPSASDRLPPLTG